MYRSDINFREFAVLGCRAPVAIAQPNSNTAFDRL